MATVQQSIDIHVPAHAVFNQLTHFEDYPEFMDEVEAVQQIDDRHLHWTTRMANRNVEWDAEITERQTDRCIAWRNTSGPTNIGMVEVEPAGPDDAHVTVTLESDAAQVPGSMAGESASELARRLKLDLARMKDFIESHGPGTEVWRSREHGAPISAAAPEGERGEPRNAPIPTSSYAAGSEGWSGEEDSTSPVVSQRAAAGQGNESTSSSARASQQDEQSRPERSMQAGASGNAALGGTAAAVGAAGGTDASAGAAMAGTPVQRDAQVPSQAAPNQASAAAGASTAGGTGLGSAEQGAGASDARTTPRTGATRSTGGSNNRS